MKDPNNYNKCLAERTLGEYRREDCDPIIKRQAEECLYDLAHGEWESTLNFLTEADLNRIEKVLCPHCGVDLMDYGIEEKCVCYITHYEDGETSEPYYADTLGWYCPECSVELNKEYKEKVLGSSNDD